MTLRAGRALRNMTLICGTVCTGSFCTALGTAKNNAFRSLNYASKPVFKGTIRTVSDIEDFARSKGCTFLFYEPGTNATVREVRQFLGEQKKKFSESKIVAEAKKVQDHCTENSFVFTKMTNP